MNPEIKARWLSALRSGEYKQGKANLKSDFGGETTYCCLGVLCEIAEVEGVVTSRKNEGGRIFFDEEYNGLPEAAQEWAGIDRLGGFMIGVHDRSLAHYNDGGVPFGAIADIIEEKF